MLEAPDPEEPLLPDNPPPTETPRVRWTWMDLFMFAGFCVVSAAIVLTSFALISERAGIGLSQSLFSVVVTQALMDLLWVGFIFFLARVVHGSSFSETIHWKRYPYSNGFLIGFGVFLAITAMIASSFAPPADPTPLEKLLSSGKSFYIFVLFGIFVAPLLEEVIVRGFLFKVFTDIGGGGVAISATAVIFALLHAFELKGNWFAIAWIFVVGSILGALRHRSDSVIPGVIVHTTYNALLFGIGAMASNASR